jgi:hypothetical protein
MITVDLHGDVPADWAPSQVRRSLPGMRRAVAVVGDGTTWGQLPTLLMVLTAMPERGADPDSAWWERLRLPRADDEDEPVTQPVMMVLDGRADHALAGLIADAQTHGTRSDAGVHVLGVALALDRSVPVGDRGAGWGDDPDTRRDCREIWALYVNGAMLRLRLERDPDRATVDYWPPEDAADRPTGPLLTQLSTLLELYRWPATVDSTAR